MYFFKKDNTKNILQPDRSYKEGWGSDTKYLAPG